MGTVLRRSLTQPKSLANSGGEPEGNFSTFKDQKPYLREDGKIGLRDFYIVSLRELVSISA
jgi:hypothetical protein